MEFSQGRNGFGDDLVKVAEFHVVNLNEIDVVHADAGEAFVDATGDAGGGEIEVGEGWAVAGDLGGEDVAVAGDVSERFAEDGLGFGRAVVGRGVD